MSLLDDARRLVENDVGSDECPHCHQYIGLTGLIEPRLGDHAPDCPWLAMPKIIAALEAAEEVTDQIGEYCDFCTGSPISGHFDGCPILVVVATMKEPS